MERQGPESLTPEQVIERYSDMVYRLAFSQMKTSHDADDVYQEVFLRYCRSAPAFESEEHRKAWLLRVTLNCCRSQWSSPWRRQAPFPGEEEGVSLSPESLELRESLLRLPRSYRAVIHLFYFEDMKIEEIASLLGSRPGTIRTRLTRARRMLRKVLEED